MYKRQPQNPPAQPADEDNTSEEEDTPDIWSDELFPLNIIPFSDNDTNDQDPDYIVPEDSTPSSSDEEEEENSEDTAEEEGPEDNMAAPNPPPTVSGNSAPSVLSRETKVSMAWYTWKPLTEQGNNSVGRKSKRPELQLPEGVMQ